MQSHALTIYKTLGRTSSIWREIPLLLGFNLMLVATAYISIQLPWSPVPITGQTFGVLLIAMALGRLRGTGLVLAYLAEGAMGLPVFAGGKAGMAVLLGPTGGYLLGFLAAAYIAGTLADCGWDKSLLKSASAMTIGTAIIFICGLIQLSMFVPIDGLLAAGLIPFLPGAAIKIALASGLLPTAWKFLRGRK